MNKPIKQKADMTKSRYDKKPSSYEQKADMQKADIQKADMQKADIQKADMTKSRAIINKKSI
jgi:uncharacterized protein YjbI with pentapeptide repeats